MKEEKTENLRLGLKLAPDSAAGTGLERLICLPLPLENWDYWHAPPHQLP